MLLILNWFLLSLENNTWNNTPVNSTGLKGFVSISLSRPLCDQSDYSISKQEGHLLQIFAVSYRAAACMTYEKRTQMWQKYKWKHTPLLQWMIPAAILASTWGSLGFSCSSADEVALQSVIKAWPGERFKRNSCRILKTLSRAYTVRF